MNDDVYYRIQMDLNALGQIENLVVCCLQWFDEYGYNERLWYTEEKFPSEEAAQAFIESEMQRLIKLLPMLRARLNG